VFGTLKSKRAGIFCHLALPYQIPRRVPRKRIEKRRGPTSCSARTKIAGRGRQGAFADGSCKGNAVPPGQPRAAVNYSYFFVSIQITKVEPCHFYNLCFLVGEDKWFSIIGRSLDTAAACVTPVDTLARYISILCIK
jgi:hypothetical protein